MATQRFQLLTASHPDIGSGLLRLSTTLSSAGECYPFKGSRFHNYQLGYLALPTAYRFWMRPQANWLQQDKHHYWALQPLLTSSLCWSCSPMLRWSNKSAECHSVCIDLALGSRLASDVSVWRASGECLPASMALVMLLLLLLREDRGRRGNSRSFCGDLRARRLLYKRCRRNETAEKRKTAMGPRALARREKCDDF